MNEASISELGLTKRSTHQDGMVPAGTLGKMHCRVTTGGWFDGVEISVGGGPGLTMSERSKIWNNRDNLVGKIIKFRFLGVGSKDAPRMPQFLGFRDPEDMS